MTHASHASLALLVLASSCARAPAQPTSSNSLSDVLPSAASVAASSVAGSATDGSADPATSPDASPANSVASASTADDPASAAQGVAPEAPLEGKDFIVQARTLFRVGACGTSGEVPSRFDPAAVARHCEQLGRAYTDYQRTWVDVAKPFIASLQPKDLPGVVVYPFGGGDLASALATFPNATEITTISLEPAGDIRPIDTLPDDRLVHELQVHRSHLGRLFEKAHSRTDNLEKESKTELPGEILFSLAALVVHGDEPVSLRYFRLRPDGSVAYFTEGDIEAAKTAAERYAIFSNVELRFRGGAADSPVRVLRHISFNLDDAHLGANPSLLAHLSAKGKVAAMTKAASHLLWSDHFASIRSWLLDHTDWMISDSTGIPPRFASAAGFAQDTYGTFNGPAPFGLVDALDAADVKKLFASQLARELPFRYGYPDKDGHGHLIVTRRN
jgi:hypothetical protein